ncbi:MAG: hypothetical protein R3A79_02345 [Nannocystaceae bacterium]
MLTRASDERSRRARNSKSLAGRRSKPARAYDERRGARSSKRRILPVAVFGSASTTFDPLRPLNAPIRARVLHERSS